MCWAWSSSVCLVASQSKEVWVRKDSHVRCLLRARRAPGLLEPCGWYEVSRSCQAQLTASTVTSREENMVKVFFLLEGGDCR